jgi:hypothetical protein
VRCPSTTSRCAGRANPPSHGLDAEPAGDVRPRPPAGSAPRCRSAWEACPPAGLSTSTGRSHGHLHTYPEISLSPSQVSSRQDA